MSNLYTKINTLYKRDMSKPRNPMILGEFSEPEFELLKDLKWRGEEKIDGRNSSCAWWPIPRIIQMRGKTENAVIPTHLLTRMQEIFTEEVLQKTFGVETEAGIVYPECVEIFGEGYGFKIQKEETISKIIVTLYCLMYELQQMKEFFGLHEKHVKILQRNLILKLFLL